MKKKVTPYKKSKRAKKQQVRQMFDKISGSYDGVNRVISLGLDQLWRRRVIKIICDHQPENALDIATGTGDLVISMAKKGITNVVGLDLSEGMLTIGRQKIEANKLEDRVEMRLGDSEDLPFDDNYFSAISVAFGVRNFENLELGLSEIYRVLKPGGIFVVLETAVPKKTLLKQGYNVYTKYILPVIGRAFSKDRDAYRYLSQSAASFPHGKDFNNILKKIGFIKVENKPQSLGVASIYSGSKQ